MKLMDREEFKAMNLEILEDFDSFCRENGIRYSIGYGTLLGAVRHKGFIPWDDDVDVMMLREDYERFRSLYRSDRFRFIDSTIIPDCYISFGRLCECERTVTLSAVPWHGHSCETGLWIDIFPVDKVSSDERVFADLFFCLHLLHKMSTRCRKAHADMSQCFNLKWKSKAWFGRTMHPSVGKLDPVSFVNCREELIRLCALQDSDRYAQISCTEYDQPQWFHKSSLESYAEYEFEGRSLMGWADYDSILKEMYGDYMTLPPVEKRKPLQNYIRFCWK